MKCIAVIVFLLAAAQPAAADDKPLLGTWMAVGQPGKTLEFRDDGMFRYVYNPSPPPTVLQLRWKTGWFGKLTLSQENGGGGRSCSLKVDGDSLTIDDGSGGSCIPNRPVKMETRFTRVK
jgi:hypothetical protein